MIEIIILQNPPNKTWWKINEEELEKWIGDSLGDGDLIIYPKKVMRFESAKSLVLVEEKEKTREHICSWNDFDADGNLICTVCGKKKSDRLKMDDYLNNDLICAN